MNALVLKRWTVSEEPLDEDGTRVFIQARAGGLVSFLFALIGLDPTHELRVTPSHIVYRSAAWSGHVTVCLPLCRLASTHYGFARPWKEAVLLTFLLFPFGLLIGPLYYFLNRRIVLGFHDVGGAGYTIAFKRSVIEGVPMDAARAAEAAAMIQKLADAQL